MKTASVSIGFRLPPALAQALCRAAAREGCSPGLLARRLVIEALTQDAVSNVELLEHIKHDNELLRRDLARAVTALLADAGKAEADEANRWVAENLSGGTSA